MIKKCWQYYYVKNCIAAYCCDVKTKSNDEYTFYLPPLAVGFSWTVSTEESNGKITTTPSSCQQISINNIQITRALTPTSTKNWSNS